jgi:formate dehydrogenase major subunit
VIGCDPEAGPDFYLGARRFARLWGTPHVFHPFQVPAGDPALPLNAPSNPCTDWVNAQCLLLVEADLAATHPVAFGRVLEAQRRGTKVIAADSRFTATMSKADLPLRIATESGNVFGLFLAKMMLEEGLHLPEAVAANFEDADSWAASFDRLSWDDIADTVRIAQADMVHIGRLLKAKEPSTVITGRRLAFGRFHGIWLTLATAMGWMGRQGGGWYPLDAGLPVLDCDSDVDAPAKSGAVRSWSHFSYHPSEARRSHTSIAAFITSGNCLSDFFLPLGDAARIAELVAHFGAFPNATCQQAHFVFPAAAWAERDGLCISNDRALQWGAKAVSPAGACRSGLDFWIGLAERFGWAEYFPWKLKNGRADHYAFYDWLVKRTPLLSGCELSKLRDDTPVCHWPSDREKLLRREPPLFVTDTGRMVPTAAATESESGAPKTAGDGYPLYFQSTRMVSRSGDAGNWWPWTQELEDIDAVQLHPQTAALLGIENGDDVVVEGEQALLEGRARISRMVDRLMVWAPRKLGARRVIVYKRGASCDRALTLLKENAQ